MDRMTTDIKLFLRENGAALIGTAALPDPEINPYSDLPLAVVFGIPLNSRVIPNILYGPDKAYVAEYTRTNTRLAEIGTALKKYLRDRGFKAIEIGPTSTDFDKETLAVEFPHKTAATRAGLGWVGKCDLLITKEFGSAVRFNTVFTNAPLRPDTPTERSSCGKCTECVDACPVSAPSGKEWEPSLQREDLLDIRACYDECKRIDEEEQERNLCGICIAVCPWTQKYAKKNC
ncbi:MAG: 4Fe-4S double cluster binding domain-containing protein [Methanosarcinaceae archaeon]|nr:4Fe-4S double cluster binding domain-containing protein [Methanosarcinaceae archaeon]